MPKTFGAATLYVSPDAALRFWKWNLGNADPGLFQAANELVKPGAVVWDIGANVGLFSFAAAARAGANGQVVSFEPDTWLVSLLLKSKNQAPADYAPITIVPKAICDFTGFTDFYIAKRGRAANFILPITTQTGGIRFKTTVPTATLDSFLQSFPPPQVVKIDVEGLENKVLRGSSNLLSGPRPVLLCEVCRENADEVTLILKHNNYKIIDRSSAKVVESAPFDMLAVPD